MLFRELDRVDSGEDSSFAVSEWYSSRGAQGGLRCESSPGERPGVRQTQASAEAVGRDEIGRPCSLGGRARPDPLGTREELRKRTRGGQEGDGRVGLCKPGASSTAVQGR